MTDVLVVLLWQLVLVGGWGAIRRIRALERTYRPPCSAQVGRLREQIVGLRSEQAFDVQEQGRRLRDLESAANEADDDLRELIRRHERAARAVLARIARLEQALCAVPSPSVLDRGAFGEPAERRRVS